MTDTSTSLHAPHVLEYPYSRSVGPVIGRFLAGLRDGKIEGVRSAAGKVIVPPTGYDPETGGDLDEFVDVGTSGVVTTWAWQPEPRANNPLERPFAWALIQLDEADTGLLHAVDAGSPDRIGVGTRVKVRWREVRAGHITDIECFELENKWATR